jgi:hypothetical protein
MADKDQLRGLAQINLGADDVGKVRDWYAQVFGIEAYFQRRNLKRARDLHRRAGDAASWVSR